MKVKTKKTVTATQGRSRNGALVLQKARTPTAAATTTNRKSRKKKKIKERNKTQIKIVEEMGTENSQIQENQSKPKIHKLPIWNPNRFGWTQSYYWRGHERMVWIKEGDSSFSCSLEGYSRGPQAKGPTKIVGF